MSYKFLDIASTPSVIAAQQANGSRQMWERGAGGDREFDRFTDNEAAFIATRDSFYMATVSETGWPYVQHRGGPPGFLKVLDEKTLGFADLRGNRQYISLGNIARNDRVALILMDYGNRARLKILAHMEARDLRADPELSTRLALPGYKGHPERAFVLRLETFDWNCPQHITPRFTVAEIESAVSPLRARIAALEQENAALRARVAGAATTTQEDRS
jgi:predicted pyridoxine 5'-phosphate oxidase superfamily flavin-nucleotide-binding protein